ncbi:MFS transporter [Parvibacter caecicola]|uniref:MFS family permease n=1 Tax=Parvibacter caecicola TaxID=747645 RepID=A0A7W5GQG0_9ACTN|nr:MFS transporter [Parvibacter caecicola]MBB3171496.1 MFS family permease [Parvibacter caecicola]MCR2040756.1 MFS transporter [Parvibacter caecicola]RNL09386.1 MFS transporter [Parvibacter caecicola]
MDTKKNNLRAWLTVLGCGMLIAGSVTFYTVVIGNFFVPASEALGSDYSSISLYSTLVYIGIACGLPFVGNWLPKIPPIGIAGFAALQSIIVAALSFSTDVMWWWIGGWLIGVGMAFTSIVFISTVLTNWFTQKTGLAIGLAWALASVASAIMSPVTVSLMEMMDWRTSLLIFAIVGAVLAVPAALFLVSYSPERKGMVPYGYDPSVSGEVVTESGVPAKRAVKSLAFVLVALALALTQIVSVINAYFPMYAESVGFAPTVGAFMISVALIFDIVLNPVIGMTIDKFGAIKAFVAWSCIGILSMLILMVSAGNEIIAYLGAGLGDTLYVLLGVGIASVASTVFGTKDYGKIFAYITIFGFAAGSVGGFIIASLYEGTGSFEAVFIFCIVTIIVIMAAVIGAGLSGKKLPHVTQEADLAVEEELAGAR